MKNFIIGILSKVTGITNVFSFMDGYKTKVGGLALVLSGLAGILTQVSGMTFDVQHVLEFVQTIPTNSSWLVMLNGLAVLGIGHKIEKKESK